MALLCCLALSAACAGDTSQGDVSGQTEINLVISDPATAADELLPLIDFVSYRITCPDSGLTPYDDSVDASGVFEVNSDPNAPSPVWEVVADLPLTDSELPLVECTIALWVFYEDEVICSGSEALTIVPPDDPSAPSKADVILECNLSVNPPSGIADIDGTFDFVHGNYCPQVFWLGSYPSLDPFVMNIETRSMDVDNSCGENCDPQTCDFTTNPPTCSPAPDPGMLTSTLSAPAGNDTFGDVTALDTTYTCDPLLPGPTEICVLVSDGDTDCDRMRCMTILCPDLCEGVDCDDGEECTSDRCNPLDGTCSNDDAPVGIACNGCNNTCEAGGVCTGPAFTADFVVNDSTFFIQSDLMPAYSATLVNPYSGAVVQLDGSYRVNNASYLGVGTADVLSGVTTGGTQSEVLRIRDAVYPQTLCGIETITSLNGFDVMFLADESIHLAGMVIEGGNASDLLWANAGNDTVRGNNSDDLIDGGPGDDFIEGGDGNDTISLWPGSGFDSIWGGANTDFIEIDAIQSQVQVTPAANPSYAFDVFFLGTPMAQLAEVEVILLNDGFIELQTCTGGAADVCNLCGNDALNGGEECDDGNNLDGDGCAADCTSEY